MLMVSYRNYLMNMRVQIMRLSLLLILMTAAFSLKAQSLSGNISDFSSDLDLSYANVDIYSGDKLVASVLADKDGNFHVKLDSGTYRCEVLYAGYHKISQEFEVTDDEKANFNLKSDPSKPKYDSIDDVSYSYDAIETEEIHKLPTRSIGAIATTSGGRSRGLRKVGGLFHKSYAESAEADYDGAPDDGPLVPDVEDEIQVGSGKLTAGEINDFSKWDLWNDLTAEELGQYQQIWAIAPLHRYMVEVTNKDGLPLVNARLELRNSSNEVLFSARSDNTGKAELWSSLESGAVAQSGLNIKATYGEQVKTIKRAKAFGKGNNRVSFNADCEQSQVVDIAFVVDATGSMGDELEFLKAELNDVIYKAKAISSKLNFRFGNVFYRDQGDAYVTRSQDFSRVLSESASFITAQRADGGGDFPEAVEVALDSAVNGLSWSEEARTRILFLVLDAPPHQNPEIQQKLKRIGKTAAAKGIRIVPVTASGIDKGTEYLMRSLALSTNGTYTFLTNHSGIGGHHIEPSTDSYEVEMLNDLLVRLIKSMSYMPDCQQEMPDLDLPYSDSLVVIDSSKTTDSTGGGIDPGNTVLQWKFYPNPTRGLVNIEANVDITELHITDLSGKILRRLTNIESGTVVQTNLYGYASGIYLIRYPLGQRWISGKVVLTR